MSRFQLKIAGITGRVHGLFESTPYYLGRYCTEEPPDFEIEISKADLERERSFRDAEALEEGMKLRQVSDPFLERLAIQRKFAEELMGRSILMVHGSAVAVDGVGYLFTAACGTGKSTHTRLWRQAFGDRAVMINDDKPFVRLEGDRLLLCGSPWSGKHGLDTNIQVPLGGICLLERGTDNRIRPLEWAEIPQMMKTLRWFMEPERVSQFDALAEQVLKDTALWHLLCNRNPEAAERSYGAMRSEV